LPKRREKREERRTANMPFSINNPLPSSMKSEHAHVSETKHDHHVIVCPVGAQQHLLA
jgi:hypothetical protein